MKRLIKMNAKEWYYIMIGCIAAVAVGAVHPAFALIFSEMLGVSRSLVLLLAALQSIQNTRYCVMFRCF